MSATTTPPATVRTTEKQRDVACCLWLSPYHPETWPLETIDRLVALRERDERQFLLEVQSMTTRPGVRQ